MVYVRRGRDPAVSRVAEYLTEPPAIAPGLVGALVDERVHLQDIVAILADLAQRGVLVIRESESDTEWTIERGVNFGQLSLQPYEDELVCALRLHKTSAVRLSDLRHRFSRKIPELERLICRALVREGYYERSPEEVRQTFTNLAGLLFGLAVALGCFPVIVLSAFSDFALGIPFDLLITAAAFAITAPHMPVRTPKGAEMRMRLEAFKRYLANLEQYTQLQEAKDWFERYLPWAIAFGLRRCWIHRFARLKEPPPVPSWYEPLNWPRTFARLYRPAARPNAQHTPLPDVSEAAQAESAPTIAGLEKSLGAGLSNLDRRLARMFDSVSVYPDQPAACAP